MPAPSAPANTAKGAVYGYVQTTDGSTLAGYVFTAYLVGPDNYDGAFILDDSGAETLITIPKVVTATSAVTTGLWSMELYGNDRIVPAGSYWRVTEPESHLSKAIELAAGAVVNAPLVDDGSIPDGSTYSPPAMFVTLTETDPNADRGIFWDDSAGAYKFFTFGTGLTMTGTTLTAPAVFGLVVSTTTITGGTTGRVLYNNGGVVGELAATTIGTAVLTVANPGAITFLRANADNTASLLIAADFRTAIGAGTGNGTVTAVSVASANGISGTSSGGATPALTIALGAITPTSVTVGSNSLINDGSFSFGNGDVSGDGAAGVIINGNTITSGTGTLTLGAFTLTAGATGTVLTTNGSGANLTTLNASNISSGDIARARIDNALSANAAPVVATTLGASGVTTLKQGTKASPSLFFGADIFGLFSRGNSICLANHLSSVGLDFSYDYIQLQSAAMIGWSSSQPDVAGTDTRISRNAAGVMQVGTTANNALGSLLLTNLTASGVAIAPIFRGAAVVIAYGASITPNADTSTVVNVGTLTGAITINAPSGTPSDGQLLSFRFIQDGTGRVITWDAAFAFGTDVTSAMIPVTASAKFEVGARWNATDSKWRVVALVRGF